MRTKTSQALLVSCFLLVLGASAAHAEIAASAEQTKPLAAGTEAPAFTARNADGRVTISNSVALRRPRADSRSFELERTGPARPSRRDFYRECGLSELLQVGRKVQRRRTGPDSKACGHANPNSTRQYSATLDPPTVITRPGGGRKLESARYLGELAQAQINLVTGATAPHG